MLQNVNRQRPGQPNKESVLDVTTLTITSILYVAIDSLFRQNQTNSFYTSSETNTTHQSGLEFARRSIV